MKKVINKKVSDRTPEEEKELAERREKRKRAFLRFRNWLEFHVFPNPFVIDCFEQSRREYAAMSEEDKERLRQKIDSLGKDD